jgi:hypothetical protein
MKSRIHGTMGLPAKTPVGRGVTGTDIIGVPVQPVGSKKVEIGKVTAGLDLLMHGLRLPEVRVLAISDIEVGVQILPVDAGTVEALKEVFAIDGQVVPVPVRKHQNGRHELISGYAGISALGALGHSEVLALVTFGPPTGYPPWRYSKRSWPKYRAAALCLSALPGGTTTP